MNYPFTEVPLKPKTKKSKLDVYLLLTPFKETTVYKMILLLK